MQHFEKHNIMDATSWMQHFEKHNIMDATLWMQHNGCNILDATFECNILDANY